MVENTPNNKDSTAHMSTDELRKHLNDLREAKGWSFNEFVDQLNSTGQVHISKMMLFYFLNRTILSDEKLDGLYHALIKLLEKDMSNNEPVDIVGAEDGGFVIK